MDLKPPGSASSPLRSPSLAEFLKQRSDLPEAEIAWLEGRGRRRFIRRGDVFCAIGQVHHEFGFVEDGILQAYTVKTDGVAVVMDFVFPGQFAIALEGVLNGTVSHVCFEAVTPCALMVWPHDVQAIATSRSPAWERLATRMTEEAYLRKHRRYMSLRVRTAEERYADLVHDLWPGWQAIPQHVLASFLDITPQYLSRLKKESALGK